MASEEEATEAVLDGEGIAVEGVAEAELTFEAGAPDGVGLVDRGGGPAGMSAAATPAFGRHESVAIEDAMDGGDGRGRALREAIPKQPLQFGGAPATAASELEDGVNDLGWSGVRTGMGPVGAIGEAVGSVLGEAIEPLVTGLATDAVAAAEFSEREEATLGVADEVEAFVHG